MGKLHTSLLIPAFQVDKNRAVVFWHRSGLSLGDPSASAWGYSTLNRLRTAAGTSSAGLQAAEADGGSAPADLQSEVGNGSRLKLRESGNTLHVYNVDFPLWKLVRASTAAPTYFERKCMCFTSHWNDCSFLS